MARPHRLRPCPRDRLHRASICGGLLMKFAAFVLAIAILGAGAARAADKGDCNEPEGAGSLSNIALAAVTAPKANFIANETDKAGCPSADAACRKKAFVVTGNEV